MKSFLILAMLFLCGGYLYAGDIDTLVAKRPVFMDTMTTTIDTIDVALDASGRDVNAFFITAVTTTGTDTVQVSTLSPDGVRWAQIGLVDLSADTVVTQIIITTTPKQFQLLDPYPIKTRFICPDVTSASLIIHYGGKRVP